MAVHVSGAVCGVQLLDGGLEAEGVAAVRVSVHCPRLPGRADRAGSAHWWGECFSIEYYYAAAAAAALAR